MLVIVVAHTKRTRLAGCLFQITYTPCSPRGEKDYKTLVNTSITCKEQCLPTRSHFGLVFHLNRLSHQKVKLQTFYRSTISSIANTTENDANPADFNNSTSQGKKISFSWP